MAKKPQDERPAEAEEAGRERRNAAIAGSVLRTLGLAESPRRVEVRPLWEGRYRVNVLVGEDAASVRIAHSFFVVADRDGAILTSTPQIGGPGRRPEPGPVGAAT